MKNNMKKIIITFLSLAFLFVGQVSFAGTNSDIWNNASNDCPDINIANYTDGIGYGDPCWTRTNINADPGDTINIRIYYHNTSNTTATNTRIKLSAPSGTSKTHSFSAQILSPQGNLYSSDVIVSIPTAQKVTFGSTRWYPNQSDTPADFLNGQNGSAVIGSNGLNIGNIAPGWGTQGSVVVSFKIGSTTPPPDNCVIGTFTANPQTINIGESSFLGWGTSGCATTKLFIGSNLIYSSGPYGYKTVNPTNNTTYTLKAYKTNGQQGDTRNITINVNGDEPQQTTGDINAKNKTCTISSGESVCPIFFTWTTKNPVNGINSIIKNNTTVVANGNNGASNFNVSYGSQSYKLYHNNKLLDTEIVNTVCDSGTVWNGTKCVTPVDPICAINNFDGTPNPINPNQINEGSNLVWVTNANCATTKLYKGDLLIAQSGQYGNKKVFPADTTTYTLKAYKQNGVLGDTKNITIKVNKIFPNITTGNLTPKTRSCVIILGHNSCTIPFSWSTQNPIGNSAITRDGTSGNYKTGNTGHDVPFTVNYRSSTFRLYNNGVELDHETVTASCATGTSWSGTKCVSSNISTCRIDKFTATPDHIQRGQTSLLEWRTSDCDRVTLDGVNVSESGTRTVRLNSTKTYNLVAFETGILPFERTAQTTVYVDEQPSSVCKIDEFTASPEYISEGESSLLKWRTSDCNSVSIDNVAHTISPDGEKTVWPIETTTYVLRATGFDGIEKTRSVTVRVDTIIPTVCSINSFTANPVSISRGEYSVLNWDTTNCGYVTLEGLVVQDSGSRTVFPINTKTYRLTATDTYGNNYPLVKEITVYVNNYNNDVCEITNFEADDTSIDEGDETTLRWETNNCERVRISGIGSVDDDGREDVSPNKDTTYVLTAYDSNGYSITDSVRIYVNEDNNNNNDCSIDSFTASNTYIDQGDEVTLRWRTSECDDVTISNLGDVDNDGEEDVYPYQTTTYVLRARGNGSESRSIKIRVGNDDNIYNSSVVTTIATNITQNSAQINGLITSVNRNNDTTYFEYGTSVYLGLRTPSRNSNNNMSFGEYLTNLSPNTIYYFRAVSEGSNGISRGAIEIFRTLGYESNNNNYNNNTTTTKIIREVVQGETVYGSLSPIMLQIENRYQMIGVGDTIDYTVFYKNISISKLTNPMVQVFIPEGITLINSSIGTYSKDDRILSVPIHDLEPNDEGTIYIQAEVDSIDSTLAQIVTTAVLIYTNPNGAQENAMAYVLNNPGNSNLLGASAFFGGKILGMNLIGWLLLIIIILLLILLTRTYYSQKKTPTH